MGLSPTLVPEGFQRASGKPFGAPVGAYPFPRMGLTRRLRRGRWGCRPEGAVLSFDAKESTKESTRHGDSGKKASIAHFDSGARNVARNGVGQLIHKGGARSCSPFSAVKIGWPFSLRCLSPLGSPTVGAGQTQPMRVGILHCNLEDFAAQKAKGISKPCWPLARAGGPVARRRSAYANKQKIAPDRRDARPVAERR